MKFKFYLLIVTLFIFSSSFGQNYGDINIFLDKYDNDLMSSHKKLIEEIPNASSSSKRYSSAEKLDELTEVVLECFYDAYDKTIEYENNVKGKNYYNKLAPLISSLKDHLSDCKDDAWKIGTGAAGIIHLGASEKQYLKMVEGYNALMKSKYNAKQVLFEIVSIEVANGN